MDLAKDKDTAASRRSSRLSRMNRTTRNAPKRCLSTDGGMLARSGTAPSRRTTPKRSVSTADGGPALQRSQTARTRSGSRKKKKGIRVAITVQKREKEENDEEKGEEEDLKIYELNVVCTGKHKRKPCWPDVDAFWGDSKDVNKDTMCDLLKEYSEEYYEERRGVDNLRPKRCHLQDCRMRGISYYKDYGWDPVELYLKANASNPVEILESYTKQIKLQDIQWTPTTDVSQKLLELGDPQVISTLTKSKLQGHPLSLALMTSETQIVVEFRGLESVVGVLGNDDETSIQETDEKGNQVWRDVKTLRALLHDKPLPVKEGKGSHRVLEVMALETYLKARIYYRGYFEGDVVSDHGIGLMLGERWWAHPLKDIMNGFQVDNAAMVYEEIELRFYSEIGYKMDNEYFDWENHGGKWVKVKKTREP